VNTVKLADGVTDGPALFVCGHYTLNIDYAIFNVRPDRVNVIDSHGDYVSNPPG
jgi:hypothetical protein